VVRQRFSKVRSVVNSLWEKLDTSREIGVTQLHLVLAGVFACMAGLFILSIALRMSGPTVHPDEWGSLINGQVLIGHSEAPIPTGSFYPAGYGLVTGLGALLTGSISGSYRFSLLANVFCAIATAWSAGYLARRGFGASKSMSRLVMALVFVMPGTLVSAMFSWPEIAIRLAYVGLVISVVSVTRKRSMLRVASLGFYVGLLPGLHGRFTLLVPVVGLIVLWWLFEAMITRLTAIVTLITTATGYLLARSMNRYVKSAVYLESYNQENRLLGRLFRPSVWPALLRTMVGQSWYLVATTFGLAAVGVVYAVLALKRGPSLRSIVRDPERTGLLFVVLATICVVFTGGLQLLYGNRGDHLIYGRYVEMLAPVLVALACVGLEKKYRESQFVWFVSSLCIFVFAIFYVLIDGGDGVKASAIRKSIVYPNIVGFDFVRYFIQPTFITLGGVFCIATGALWWLSRRAGSWAIIAVVGVLAVGVAYSGQHTMLSRTDVLDRTTQSLPFVRESHTALIGYDGGVRNDMAYYYLRYKLHPVKLVREFFSDPDAVISEDYKCIYGFGNKAPSDGDWAIVADEPVLQRVLWKRLTAAHC
jgi:hypothetical protein